MSKAKEKLHCPHCGHELDVSWLARLIGARGGRVTGASKARTPEQARAAANIRWAKQKPAKEGKKK